MYSSKILFPQIMQVELCKKKTKLKNIYLKISEKLT